MWCGWLMATFSIYFEPKHAVLFLVALLVLLLLGMPYTVTLTAAPWIQRSRFKRVSSLYNRFKPLFDAYMGPYKDRYRYILDRNTVASESGSDSPVLQHCQHQHSGWSSTEPPPTHPLIVYTNRPLYNTQTIQDKAAEWTGAILPRTSAHFLHCQSLYYKHWCWR